MKFDYSVLRGKIKEVYHTQSNFAEAINISSNALSLKLNNVCDFNQKDIVNSIVALSIDPLELHKYFFDYKVGVGEHREV